MVRCAPHSRQCLILSQLLFQHSRQYHSLLRRWPWNARLKRRWHLCSVLMSCLACAGQSFLRVTNYYFYYYNYHYNHYYYCYY